MSVDQSNLDGGDQDRSSSTFLHTILAVVLFFGAYLILGSVMAIVWIFMVGVEMWLPDVIISATGAIVGCLAGVFAGVHALKAWLPHSNRKVVFGFFLSFIALTTIGMLISGEAPSEYLPLLVGNIAGCGLAYHGLWRGQNI